MNKKGLWFLLSLLFLQSTLSFAQKNTTHLIDSLSAYLVEKHIPGASICIVKSDTILFAGGIGMANVEKKEKVTGDHLFRLGSVSKSFTTLGLLKILQEKNISLDTPINSIDSTIPFTNSWSSISPITIAHLLEHTSGFDDFHLHAIYNKEDAKAPPVAKMVARHKNSLDARWQPGTKKTYSNPGYIVAGHILEVLTQAPYHAYLKENILEPLAMESSGFYFKSPAAQLPMAQGYQYRGGEYHEVSFTTINGGPAGEFCSSAKDMVKYLQFMLKKDGRQIDSLLFSDAIFSRIEKAKTNIAAKKGLPYGYGLGNYSVWKNGYLFHGHSGGIDGFSSRYVYSRAADLGISVSINRQGNANAVIDEVLNLLIGKPGGPPADRKTVPIPQEVKEKFAGFYEFRSPRNQLFAFTDEMLAGLILDFEGDRIVARSILGKAKDTLYHAGQNQFYKNWEGVPSTMFFESDEGKPAFWVNENYTEMASRNMRLVKFFGILISLLLFFSFTIYSLFTIIRRRWLKKEKIGRFHLCLFGAGLSFLTMFVAFSLVMEDIQKGGELNFNSLLFFVSSLVFALLSFVSIFGWFEGGQKKRFRFFYILSSIAAVMVSIYFWNIGFIGLRLWSY